MDKDYIGQPWIGVDLDGTLAHYDGWKGYEHIGAPIPLMVERVKKWTSEGKTVKIFTARVSSGQRIEACHHIESWCLKHIGYVLPITCTKDIGCVEIWDDRCVQVVQNTGMTVGELL